MYDRSVIGDLYFDETYDRYEDYIFWLIVLKRGMVAKGNHKVLATYVVCSNSKNSNKTKLVKSMYRVYHKPQRFNWLKRWIYVFRYALYSKKKYRDVRQKKMMVKSCLSYVFSLFGDNSRFISFFNKMLRIDVFLFLLLNDKYIIYTWANLEMYLMI